MYRVDVLHSHASVTSVASISPLNSHFSARGHYTISWKRGVLLTQEGLLQSPKASHPTTREDPHCIRGVVVVISSHVVETVVDDNCVPRLVEDVAYLVNSQFICMLVAIGVLHGNEQSVDPKGCCVSLGRTPPIVGSMCLSLYE